jgi:hypothetical protein
MTDKQIIKHICDEWQNNGGDATGFAFCWKDILVELKERETSGQYSSEDEQDYGPAGRDESAKEHFKK